MGFYGIIKGAVKTIEGIVEGDGEKIVKGIGKILRVLLLLSQGAVAMMTVMMTIETIKNDGRIY